LKKVMMCLYDIIKRYSLGNSFIFVPKNDDNTFICCVSCLLLVLTDKYYRTYEGFIEMIHMHLLASFAYRLMLLQKYPYPLFLFLHGMSCLLQSYPSMFEFKKELLSFILYHSISMKFSTMSVCQNPSQSLYCYLFENKPLFVNDDFNNFDFNFIDFYKMSLILFQQSFYLNFSYFTKDKAALFKKSSYMRETVDFKNMGLATLPRFFYINTMKGITRKLILNNNNLRFIHDKIALIPHLESLSFSCNDLLFIPQWHLTHMTSLTFLDISEASTNASHYEMIRFDLLTSLKFLNISNRQVTQDACFPSSLRFLIARNSFKVLPKIIHRLPNLVSLDLSENIGLNSSSVFYCTKLSALTLSHCNKSNVPNSISAMTNLTTLDLSCNQLQKLPFSLFSLEKLVNLVISRNDIKYISSAFFQLTNLRMFDLGYNNSLPNFSQDLDQFKKNQQKAVNIHEIPLHVLSDAVGWSKLRQYVSEFKNSKSDSVRIYENFPLDYNQKQSNFHLIFHNFEDKIGFVTPTNDCYLLVLFKDSWSTVLTHWKYHLLHSSFNNKYNTKEVKLQFIMFFDEKPSDCERIINVVKANMDPLLCEGTVVFLREKKKNAIENRIKKVFGKYTPTLYDDNLMKIAKEVKMASFNPPVMKQGLFFKTLHTFDIPNFTVLLNALHRLGVVLSVNQSLEGIKINEKVQKVTMKTSADLSNSNFVIADIDFLRVVDALLVKNARSGFGFLEDINSSLNEYHMSLEMLNGIVLYLEMYYDTFVVREEFLSAFNLHEKYFQFVQNKTNLSEFLTKKEDSKESQIPPVKEVQQNITNAPENPFAMWDGSSSSSGSCKTPTKNLADSNGKSLYFQPRNIRSLTQDEIETYWPSLHNTKEIDFGRKMTGIFFPPLLFSTYVVYANLEGMNVIKTTKSQCFMSKVVEDQHYYFFVYYSERQFVIRTRFRAITVKSVFLGGKLMGEMVKIFENVQRVMFPRVHYEERILCPKCLTLGGEDLGSCVPKKEIDFALANNYPKVAFEQGHECYVSTCALDLVIADLRNSKNPIQFFDLQKMVDTQLEGDLLGIGSSAKVFLTTVNGNKAAVKLFSMDPSMFSATKGEGCAMFAVSKSLTELKRELFVMKRIDSPYIVKLYGISLEPVALIMDYCDKGTLYDYIQNQKNEMTWKDIVHFSYQIASGMAEIHSLKLIHRDLKSPNILLKTENGEVKCLVSDFGTSGPQLREENVFVDNPKWVAPEVLRGSPFIHKSDVYSFGIIMWELVERKEPFGDARFPSQLKQAIIKGVRPCWSEDRYPYNEFILLTEASWSEDPNLRPSFEEIVSTLQKLKTTIDQDFMPIEY
ncbi:protein kinase, putative, partial [Entamoeba invadens IP1]